MEEQKNQTEEQKTQFISPEEGNVDALFNEFRELDFGPEGNMQTMAEEDPKLKKFQLFAKTSDVVFKVSILILFVTGIDATLRNMDSAGFLSDMGLCSYIGYGIALDNTECQTYSARLLSAQSQEKTLKSDYVSLLDTFVERKIQALGITESPEVQFIQKKTNGDRILLSKISEDFNRIRTSNSLHGLDIECSKMQMSEKGDVNVTCDFYGNSLNSGVSESQSTTSRSTALAFFDKLTAPGSPFRMLETPKMLEMENFMSSDLGTKGTFTTKTTVNLKLRYINSNQP